MNDYEIKPIFIDTFNKSINSLDRLELKDYSDLLLEDLEEQVKHKEELEIIDMKAKLLSEIYAADPIKGLLCMTQCLFNNYGKVI